MCSRRNPTLAVIVCLLILGQPLLLPALADAQQAPGKKAGVVTGLKGSATVARATVPSPSRMNFRDDVLFQDRIQTERDALVRVLMGGKALVTIRELSNVTITEEATRSKVEMRGLGRLALQVLKRLMSPGDSVEVFTPNAVAAVRGSFVVVTVTEVGGTPQTDVAALEVSAPVAVCLSAKPTQCTDLGSRQTVRLQGTGENTTMSQARGLSAQEFAELASVADAPRQSEHTDRPPAELVEMIDAAKMQEATLLANAFTGKGDSFGLEDHRIDTTTDVFGQNTDLCVNCTIILGADTGGGELPPTGPVGPVNTVGAGQTLNVLVPIPVTSTGPGQVFLNVEGGKINATGSLLDVPQGAVVGLGGPLIQTQDSGGFNSEIVAGGSVLDVQSGGQVIGNLIPAGNPPAIPALINLDPTTLTAQSILNLAAGATLAINSQLLKDVGGTITTISDFIKVAGTLISQTVLPLIEFIGTQKVAIGGAAFLVEGGSVQTGGSLLRAANATMQPNQQQQGFLILKPSVDGEGQIVSRAQMQVGGSFLDIENSPLDLGNKPVAWLQDGSSLRTTGGPAVKITNGSLVAGALVNTNGNGNIVRLGGTALELNNAEATLGVLGSTGGTDALVLTAPQNTPVVRIVNSSLKFTGEDPVLTLGDSGLAQRPTLQVVGFVATGASPGGSFIELSDTLLELEAMDSQATQALAQFTNTDMNQTGTNAALFQVSPGALGIAMAGPLFQDPGSMITTSGPLARFGAGNVTATTDKPFISVAASIVNAQDHLVTLDPGANVKLKGTGQFLALTGGGGASTVNHLSNGTFEKGFAGWDLFAQEGSFGDIFRQSGNKSPISSDQDNPNGFPVPTPPGGRFAAMTDQQGPGSYSLSRLIDVPRGNPILRYALFVGNRSPGFLVPNSLDYNFDGGFLTNQQVRVDILNGNVAFDDQTVDGDSVRRTLYQTTENDDPKALRDKGYVVFEHNLKEFEGQTVRLRFSEADNDYFIQMGVDDVQVLSNRSVVTVNSSLLHMVGAILERDGVTDLPFIETADVDIVGGGKGQPVVAVSMGSRIATKGKGAFFSASNTNISGFGSFAKLSDPGTTMDLGGSLLVASGVGIVDLGGASGSVVEIGDGTTLTLAGSSVLEVTSPAIVSTTGPVVDVAGNGKLDSGAGPILLVKGDPALTEKDGDPANSGDSGLFLGTERPLRPGTEVLKVSGGGANVNVASNVMKMDFALLEATAPLLRLLGADNLNRATLTAGSDALLLDNKSHFKFLNASDLFVMHNANLTVTSGALANVMNGSKLAVNGNFLTMLGNTTLNILNGFLLNASGGSFADIQGSLVNFVGGNNRITVTNNLAPTGFLQGVPVFSSLGGTKGFFISNASALKGFDNDNNRITINGTPLAVGANGGVTGSLIAITGASPTTTVKIR